LLIVTYAIVVVVVVVLINRSPDRNCSKNHITLRAGRQGYALLWQTNSSPGGLHRLVS